MRGALRTEDFLPMRPWRAHPTSLEGLRNHNRRCFCERVLGTDCITVVPNGSSMAQGPTSVAQPGARGDFVCRRARLQRGASDPLIQAARCCFVLGQIARQCNRAESLERIGLPLGPMAVGSDALQKHRGHAHILDSCSDLRRQEYRVPQMLDETLTYLEGRGASSSFSYEAAVAASACFAHGGTTPQATHLFLYSVPRKRLVHAYQSQVSVGGSRAVYLLVRRWKRE